MLNKVKRILQWFIGGCYILSGLACIGEYTMPAIILINIGRRDNSSANYEEDSGI